jgi:hypothetical protein
MRHNAQIIVATALGLIASMTLFVNAFAAQSLEGLDIIGTPDKLHIMLSSHQILPARVVRQQSDEIILEISQIDTRSPIATHFGGQSMVSHVSMQALDDTHMRIVLRGQDLPQADVAFKPVSLPQAGDLFRYERSNYHTSPATLHRPAMGKTALKNNTTKLSAAQSAQDKTLTPRADKSIAGGGTGKATRFATPPQGKLTTHKPAPLFAALPMNGEGDVDREGNAETTVNNQQAAGQNAQSQHMQNPEAGSGQADPYETLLNKINTTEKNTNTRPQTAASPQLATLNPKPGDDDLADNTLAATPGEKSDSKTGAIALEAQAQVANETDAVLQGINWLRRFGPSLLGGMIIALGGGLLLWVFKRKQNNDGHNTHDLMGNEIGEDAYWPDETPPELVKPTKRQASRPVESGHAIGLRGLSAEALAQTSANALPNPSFRNPQAVKHYQQMQSRGYRSDSATDNPLNTRTGDNRPASPAQQARQRLLNERSNNTSITNPIKPNTLKANQLQEATGEAIRRSASIKQRREEWISNTQHVANTTPPQDLLKQRNGVRESLAQMQSGKGPLPANPEVLDFLKSVADYMDNPNKAVPTAANTNAKPTTPRR